MHRISPLALALIAALGASAVAAEAPAEPPTRIRGTIETFADHTLTVKARDGATVTVTLAPGFKVRSVVAETLADIKPDDKVGITSLKGKAVEITIFPASMTNVRMLQIPWDLEPGSLMTNAPVLQVSGTGPGRMIEVTLQGKKFEFTVPAGTPIVTFGPGDASLLKPGAAVFIIARKRPDGHFGAAFVTAEKNGVKPPM
jgi:hypothetical protein